MSYLLKLCEPVKVALAIEEEFDWLTCRRHELRGHICPASPFTLSRDGSHGDSGAAHGLSGRTLDFNTEGIATGLLQSTGSHPSARPHTAHQPFSDRSEERR